MPTTYVTVNSPIRARLDGTIDTAGVVFHVFRQDAPGTDVATSGAGGQPAGVANVGQRAVAWQMVIDQAFVNRVLDDDEMSCELRVKITYQGKTYPWGDIYVLYRNALTLKAVDANGAVVKHVECVCSITPPDNAGVGAPADERVVTAADGTVTVPLNAPGDVAFAFVSPHQLTKWNHKTGMAREAQIKVVNPCRFVWPVQKPRNDSTPYRQYVNLPQGADNGPDLSARSNGKIFKFRVGKGNAGLSGEDVFVKASLTGPDKVDSKGKPLQLTLTPPGGGATTITVGQSGVASAKLTADKGTLDFELDFKGYGGVAATLQVGTDATHFDQTIKVVSWRSVTLQFHYPVAGFFENDQFPDAIRDVIVTAFNEVFVEVTIPPPTEIRQAFGNVDIEAEPNKLQIVQMSDDYARRLQMDPGGRVGDSAFVLYKMNDPSVASPATLLAHIPEAAPTWQGTHNRLHIIMGHSIYSEEEETVSFKVADSSDAGKRRKEIDKQIEVINAKIKKIPTMADRRTEEQRQQHRDLPLEKAALEQEKKSLAQQMFGPESEPTEPSYFLRTVDLDETTPRDGLVLEWSKGHPSYWEDEKGNGGTITDAFLKITQDAKGPGTYQIVLPADDYDDPGSVVAPDNPISIYLKFRSFKGGVAGNSLITSSNKPLIAATWSPTAGPGRAAFVVIHEVGHVFEMASSDTKYKYEFSGPHCAFGVQDQMKSRLTKREKSARVKNENRSDEIKKLQDSKRLTFYDLVAEGKFGSCVMFTPTGSTVSEAKHLAACHFCKNCAPLLRTMDLSPICGAKNWP